MLQSISFQCPSCKKMKVTFADSEMAESIINRQGNIQTVLPEKYFPATYREIFISRMCCECQKSIFGDSGEGDFDIDMSADSKEVMERIDKMFNNFKKG